MAEDKQNKKLKALADRLLDRLGECLENQELDHTAIKAICATMKDLKDITGAAQKEAGGITVELGKELESLSR